MRINFGELSNIILNHRSRTSISTRAYRDDVKTTASNYDNSTTQASFLIEEKLRIVFVHDIKALDELVDFTTDLRAIPMTAEDEAVRSLVARQQKNTNSSFHDDMQLVITNVLYDSDLDDDNEVVNTLYLEARKVLYSFIVALRSRKFPENSSLYNLSILKTGVLAPVITHDNSSMLVRRTADDLFSVHGGFIDLKKQERLNFDGCENVFTKTAITELIEEFFGSKEKPDESRVELSNNNVINGISVRRTANNPIGTFEFVSMVVTNCYKKTLEYIAHNNEAIDAKEHVLPTNNLQSPPAYKIIPLDSRQRDELLSMVLGNPITPGESLFVPVLLSLCDFANSGLPLPTHVKNSLYKGSGVFSLSMFSAQHPMKLRHLSEKGNNFDDEIENNIELGFNLHS